MARKTLDYVVKAGGRDDGKVFILTEMSAMDGEDWALRAFIALAKGNTDIPASMLAGGLPGLVALGAAIGLQGLMQLNYADVRPLLDDMLACVTVRPDPSNMMLVRKLFPTDIEEVGTLLKIREALIELHTGFSVAAALSQLQDHMAKVAAQNSSDTPT